MKLAITFVLIVAMTMLTVLVAHPARDGDNKRSVAHSNVQADQAVGQATAIVIDVTVAQLSAFSELAIAAPSSQRIKATPATTRVTARARSPATTSRDYLGRPTQLAETSGLRI
jgi:hypothetical protein